MKKVVGVVIAVCIGVPIGLEVYSGYKDRLLVERCAELVLGVTADELQSIWGKPDYQNFHYDEKSISYNYNISSFFASGPIAFTLKKDNLVLVSKTCEDIW